MPEGMDSAADLPKITEGLLKRGYTAAQIRKILGGNFMRVFRQVEQVSKQMRAQKSQQLRSAARQMSSAH
jgi:membrane dipeptidase